MGNKVSSRKGARKKVCVHCGQPFHGGKGRNKCPSCRRK